MRCDTGGVAPPPDGHRGQRFLLLIVGALLVAIADWVATWLLIDETAQGTREVAGFSEGNLRALQNPVTVLVLLTFRPAWRRYGSRLAELGRAGFILTAFVLGVVLVGNIVEFGLWGEGPVNSQDPGAAIFFTGLLFLPFGVVLVAAAVARAVWRQTRSGPESPSRGVAE